MTKEQALADCRNLDVENGVVSLWVFKRRSGGGFTARSIDMTDALTIRLKAIVQAFVGERTEVADYQLLEAVNETGCLHVGTDETSFPELQQLIDQPAEEQRYRNERDLKAVLGYVVRVRAAQRVLYCVRRVPEAWQTKKAKNVLNVVLRANQLDVAEDPAFTIAKSFDFFVLGEDLLIVNKSAFESLLSYRVEYANAFGELQQEQQFVACFSTMQPLVEHVGTNSMHLRRMAVIKQKAHYADADYMARLRDINAQRGWNIQFDAQGRIVPSEETMKVIMQVLLNHRLFSQLSLGTFDVPSSSAV
jgi:hypothetical protein